MEIDADCEHEFIDLRFTGRANQRARRLFTCREGEKKRRKTTLSKRERIDQMQIRTAKEPYLEPETAFSTFTVQKLTV